MRIADSIARFLHDEFTKLEPAAEVYLFGLRVDENKIPSNVRSFAVISRNSLLRSENIFRTDTCAKGMVLDRV